jgi:hypothetical protein
LSRRSLAGLAAPAIALAPAAGLQLSAGFTTARPSAAVRVTCAVGLPPSRSVLYCASPAITKGAYDRRGVVRLTPRGLVQVVVAGSDLLNAIDGNTDRGAPRPVLAAGASWTRSGYSCTRRRQTVTCRRGLHGFAVSLRRLATF